MIVQTGFALDVNSVAASLATVAEIEERDPDALVEATEFPSAHLASLLLNAFLWILLCLFGVRMVWSRLEHPERPLDHNLIIFGVCWGVIYLFYLIEAFSSSTFRMLVQKKRLSRVAQHYQKLVETDPQIKLIGQSYHFRGQKHSNDTQRRRRLWGSWKVVTNTAVATFEYDFSADNSDEFPESCSHFDLLKIKLNSEISFADHRTEDAYAQTIDSFNQANQSADFHYAFRETKKIPGYTRYIFAVNDRSAGLFYSPFIFIVFTVFLVASWPYRAWVQQGFGRVSLTLRKSVSWRGRGV
jgi:hypothetical protein